MSKEELKEIGYDEIAKHNSSDSVWFIYEDFVLDVTSFLHEHPGGDQVLLEVAGKDGTSAFRDIGHSKDAEQMVKDYVIGRVNKKLQRDYSPHKKCFYFAVPTVIVIAGLVIAYRFLRRSR